VGVIVLAGPIVRLLYERGRFSPHDTASTASALWVYSLGLVAYTSIKVLAPAFYALGTPRVPLLASALAVATNLLINLLTFQRFGYRAVALGASLGAMANVLVLIVALQGRLGGVVDREVGSRLGRILLSALLMAPVVWFSWRGLEGAFGTQGLLAQGLTCLVPVGLGVLAYGGASALLGLPESRQVLGLLRRRRAPSPPPTP
jgi:putative peptidoglycan lipid II flippase